jgi:hypothetical protein
MLASMEESRWKVDARIVCHDLKFGDHVTGVLEWPNRPPQEIVARVLRRLVEDALDRRGQGAVYADFTDIDNVTVVPTTDPATIQGI